MQRVRAVPDVSFEAEKVRKWKFGEVSNAEMGIFGRGRRFNTTREVLTFLRSTNNHKDTDVLQVCNPRCSLLEKNI